jgi:hypothetical protein
MYCSIEDVMESNRSGPEGTERYIARRQESAVLPRDADDWMFIQKLDASMSYDSTMNTRLMFERLCKNASYRSEIECALMQMLGHPAFDCLVLDELLGNSEKKI